MRYNLHARSASLALLAASLGLPTTGDAQECALSGGAVRVEALISGADTVSVRYLVVNDSEETLSWLSIGAADEERTRSVPGQAPVVTAVPPGWRGLVIYPEETAFFHLWWEVTEREHGIPSNGTERQFAIRAPGESAVTRGLVYADGRPVEPIDFTRLPFTVGASGGSCWWGRTVSAGA